MMRYPPSFVDRVKRHFRLSEVISRRIPLRRNGREYSACCPFHNEKTPSFTVNDEKGFYHCFGCGAHGDSLSFVMEYDRLHYTQALESLAREAGIALPLPDPQAQAHYDREEKLLKLMEAAARWYADQLVRSVGHAARNYLHERGIDRSTIDTFQLGYAPQQRDALKFAMSQQGFSESQMVDCGLLIKVEGKPSYDRFRGRIMFPICREDGRVVAFGGRLLEAADRAPKYLNSPETILFKKHEVLFNMHRVRQVAHDAPYLLVVEGYTDVMALHAYGIPYAVAPLGTAFGESHLQQLWRYHSTPVLCFDGDRAGQKAMLRATDLVLPHLRPDRLLRFCALPNGEDPDSFVRSSGTHSLEVLVKRSLSISELLWNIYIGNREFSTPEQLAVAERELMAAAQRIQDAGLRKRIVASYQNRIWHLSKQPSSRQDTAARKTPPVRNLGRQLLLPLEQMFALVARYPALLREAEVEHAFFEWDWQGCYCAAAVSQMVARSESLGRCRYVMAEFLTREFPQVDESLQKQYTQGVIPAHIYGAEEEHGLPEARALFARLREKMERILLNRELEQLAASGSLTQDEQRANQLLELIRLQQQSLAHAALSHEDAYI